MFVVQIIGYKDARQNDVCFVIDGKKKIIWISMGT
jgi:hypothetical protein